MRIHRLLPVIALSFASAAALAQETGKKPENTTETVKATYLITGLHCPPCTRTVESSLRKVKGVRSVRVHWQSKNARIEFDEAVLPAQKVAELIADTPHMMGGDMRYAGWLALQAPEIKDEASAQRAKDALSKIEGVQRVVAYPAQHSVGVLFATKGELKTPRLIEALKDAGFSAKNF